MLRKRVSHALAVLEIGARHRRQILHCDMRRDLAGADALLHRFGKLFHQSQSARDPAHAAIKTPCQIFQVVAEASFQFCKQPSLLQRRLRFGKTHRSFQDQRIRFAHSPDDRVDRVAPQLLQSGDAFVTVDDLIPIRFVRFGNDHDRRLLSRGRQRCQQPPLPFRIPNAQMLITAVELVKFQLHFGFSSTATHSPTDRIWDCVDPGGSVSASLESSVT